jgi:hypothetical protein
MLRGTILAAFVLSIPGAAAADVVTTYCRVESLYVGSAIGSYATGNPKSIILRDVANILTNDGQSSVVVAKVLKAVENYLDVFERDNVAKRLGVNPANKADIERLIKSMMEGAWVQCLARQSR